MKNLVAAKWEEVICALSGHELYRLRPQYVHLGVDHMTWQRKKPDQRKKLIPRFDECSLLSESITSPSKPQLKLHSDVNPANEQGSSSRNLSDPAGGTCHISISIHSPSKQLPTVIHTQRVSLPGPSSACHISISPSERGITSLHQGVLQAIWDKAETLRNRERGLQRAASSDLTAWSVQSLSSAVPHFITSKADGQFLCVHAHVLL